jgi:hypothetical protein
MFRELNRQLREQIQKQNAAYKGDPVFELHPLQVQGFLEAVWELWRRVDERSLSATPGQANPTSARAVVVGLGNVDRGTTIGVTKAAAGQVPLFLTDAVQALLRSRDGAFGSSASGARLPLDVTAAVQAVLAGMLVQRRDFISTPWLHLMYAYLVENTRIYEILSRVLQGGLTDEPFGTFSDESFRWLRLTEDLFYRDGASSLVTSITSSLRPDVRATRRNAYQRMFGIDLNHGAADGGAYPYLKAQVANGDFVRSLQDLLRELWRGFINARNESGPRTTDDAQIRELVAKLGTMMTARRLSGTSGRANLAREEFVAVATMEWFELTVETDTALVADLKANADQSEDRLQKIGERVKLPAHGRSRSFFQLAGRLPQLLREIEEGEWGASRAIEELYDPTVTGNVANRTTEIINHWSIATGVDLKSVPVASQPR